MVEFFCFSSRRRHTRCALVTGVQTCALPISMKASKFTPVYGAAMTFQPQMSNRIGGFKVVGRVQRREWNGITADLTQVERAAYAGGHYVAQDPRLRSEEHTSELQSLIRMSDTDFCLIKKKSRMVESKAI